MEQLEKQPITVQEYRDILKKKTCNVREFGEMMGLSYPKALRLTHIEGFPLIKIGRDRRIILGKLDKFLEDHIGDVL